MDNNKGQPRVFQKVEGKLVPKPGNARDPKRRYTATSHADYPDETILVEFTDDEEKQRNAEEATWEAEKPLREARAREQAEREERFRQTIKYENRIVAFVDVMGWRDFVQRSASDENAVRRVGSMLIGHQRSREFKKKMLSQGEDAETEARDDFFPEVAQFSDSFILSCDPQRHYSLLSDLKLLAASMLHMGLLVRGGITYGPMYHRDSVAFGPAVTEAYDLEQQAVYPRIIARLDLGNAWFPGMRIVDREDNFLGFNPTWRRDHDGYVFLDFLQPLIAMGRWQGLPPGTFKHHFSQFREIVGKLFAQYRAHPRLAGKYYWLARYFNAVLAEYPDSAVEPIALE